MVARTTSAVFMLREFIKFGLCLACFLLQEISIIDCRPLVDVSSSASL